MPGKVQRPGFHPDAFQCAAGPGGFTTGGGSSDARGKARLYIGSFAQQGGKHA